MGGATLGLCPPRTGGLKTSVQRGGNTLPGPAGPLAASVDPHSIWDVTLSWILCVDEMAGGNHRLYGH